MELVSVTGKLVFTEGLGVLEVQEVDAVFLPNNKVGSSKPAAAGGCREGQFRAATKVTPALGLELLQEAQRVLASVGDWWGGG